MKSIQPMQGVPDDTPYVVAYQAYDIRLPEVFEKVKRLIRDAAGPVPVAHIGSSAIPGVGGRNVLDIAVLATEPAQPAVRDALHDLGFETASFPHYLPLLVGQIADGDKNYPMLLYIVTPEADILREWLRFRDYMRSHPEEAKAYDTTKREAIAHGKDKGDDYQEAKNPFIASIVEKMQR